MTHDESGRWCKRIGVNLGAGGHPDCDIFKNSISIATSGLVQGQALYFSKLMALVVKPYDECLLWVTQSGVWSSLENFHLFYRLRQSYGERRRLLDAPGHLFLDYESVDLATFAHLGILFGWDYYLLGNRLELSVFASHDGFLDVFTSEDSNTPRLEEIAGDVSKSGVPFRRFRDGQKQ